MMTIIIIIIIIKWSASGPSRFSPDKIVLYQLRRGIFEFQVQCGRFREEINCSCSEMNIIRPLRNEK
jgi:hypothetical protein